MRYHRLFAVSLLFAPAIMSVRVAAAQYLAYVTTNQPGAVAVIDTATNAVIDSLPAGLTPAFISVAPDGSRVYVVNANSKTIDVFDAATRRVIQTIDFPNPNRMLPQGFAISRDGTRAYVSNGDNGFLEPGTIFVFDVSSGTLVDQIRYDRANNMALSPDGTTLYVDGFPGLGMVDTYTDALTSAAGLSDSGNDSEYSVGVLTVSPDGRLLYTISCWGAPNNDGATRVCVVDTSTKTVSSISLSTNAGLANVIALSPSGDRLYVAYQDDGPAVLAVIDTASRSVVARIPIGNSPYGIATTPDGAYVYVTNLASDTVSVIDAASNMVIATIPVAGQPHAITIAVKPGSASEPTPTPRPTRTPTVSPLPSLTPTPDAVVVAMGSATAARGDDVAVTATVTTGDKSVAAVQYDVAFSGPAPIVSCTVNPGINKALTAFSLSDGRVRVVVLGDNVEPIPDGSVLCTCIVHVDQNATPGTHYELYVSHVVASDAAGTLLAATGSSGFVTVARPPSPTPTITATVTPTETRPPLPACGSAVDARTLAYIANFESNSVSVVDTRCGVVIDTIDLSVGIAPLSVGMAPDGRHAYVSMLHPGTPPQVAVIDTATNTVAATVALDTQADPTDLLTHDLAVAPDGANVYVIDDSRSALTVLDAASRTVTAHIAVGIAPRAIALSTDGHAAYVTRNNPCYYSMPVVGPCRSGIDVVDLDPNSPTFQSVTRTVFVDNADPIGIAVTPLGIAYTTNTYNPSATVSAVDLATGATMATITVATAPRAVVASQDGRFIYVSSQTSQVVVVIDTSTNTVAGTIPLETPMGIALTPDGQTLAVTDEGAATVSLLDTASSRITATVSVGLAPRAVAIGEVPAPAQVPVQALSGSAPPIDANAGGGGCAIEPTGTMDCAPLLALLAIIGARFRRAAR